MVQARGCRTVRTKSRSKVGALAVLNWQMRPVLSDHMPTKHTFQLPSDNMIPSSFRPKQSKPGSVVLYSVEKTNISVLVS